jgi:NADH:ubiquinone oxidoreductase subunit K
MVYCIDDQCNVVVGYIVRSLLSIELMINAMLLLVVYLINQTLLLIVLIMNLMLLLVVRC